MNERKQTMVVGVPKEVKEEEYRVGLVPAGAQALVSEGHQVVVQKGAGIGSGIGDQEYLSAGTEIVESASEVYEKADMIIKVKEPLAQEYDMFRPGQILYAYLHLAPAPELTAALLKQQVIAVAYETIQLPAGSLPLLLPMSEVAGRMAVQVGAHFLEKTQGGRGVILGGVPGVSPGTVVIIGAGVAGLAAAKIAVGMGAEVLVLERNIRRLEYIDDLFLNRVITLASNHHTISNAVSRADLLIASVLVPGALTPKLVTREMVKNMKEGSVIVDISIDQGGCVETSRFTTHRNPIFVEEGVIHYGVANIPGVVSRTSTFALTNATLPYALKLAQMGVENAVKEDRTLATGVNVYKGRITHPSVAADLGYPYHELSTLV